MSESGAGPGMDFLFEKVPGKSGKGKRDEVKPVEDKTDQDKTESSISDQVKPVINKPNQGKSDEDISEQVKPVADKLDQVKSEEGITGQVKPITDKLEQDISGTGKSEEVKPSAVDNANQENLISGKPLKVKVIRESIDAASSRRQRIAVWSPLISATMWYLKTTTPMFSISDEARSLIEEGLEKKYPELFKRIKDEMGK
jgi:hypothetical protein